MPLNPLVGSDVKSPRRPLDASPVDFVKRETAVVRESAIQSERGLVTAFVRRPGARVKKHAKDTVAISGGIGLSEVPANLAVAELARKVEIVPPPAGTSRLAESSRRTDNQQHDRR